MTGEQIYYKVSREKRLKFYEVPFAELDGLVRIGFGDDPELIEKYQEMNTDFEETVKRNVARIKEYTDYRNLTLYELRYGCKVIGFMALDLSENLLYSFGVNIQYRKQNILSVWMEDVKKIFGNLFSCVLYNNNQRAIRFLVKNGMRITNKNESLTYLIYM